MRYRKKGFQRLIGSFRFAVKGLLFMLRNEPNARIHTVATVAVVALGLTVELSGNEWLWVALAISLVWISEGLNTAVEHFANLLHPAEHPIIGHVKDLMAGVVLIAAFFAIAVFMVVFVPRFF